MIKYQADGIWVNDVFLSIQHITTECLTQKIKLDKLGLLTIGWPSHRGFDGLVERIVLPSGDIDRVIELITGVQVYFGEIAGKHSEVYGTIDSEDITVTYDELTVLAFLRGHPYGHEYTHSFLFKILFSEEEDDEELINMELADHLRYTLTEL